MVLGNFQKKALGVALLILTFSILVMSYANYKKTKVDFPPLINECPDYFVYDEAALPYPTCTDTKNIYGSSLVLTISGDYVSTNDNSMCKKKAWASTNKVAWDGISNDVSLAPC